jgi:hypothetical protein
MVRYGGGKEQIKFRADPQLRLHRDVTSECNGYIFGDAESQTNTFLVHFSVTNSLGESKEQIADLIG